MERREKVVVKKKGARRVKCKRRARLSYADVSEEYYSARQPARYLPGALSSGIFYQVRNKFVNMDGIISSE